MVLDLQRIRSVLIALSFAIAAGVALACAGDLDRFDRGGTRVFEHKTRGYRIGMPRGASEEGWKRVNVEGADLVFVGADGSSMTLISRCRRERTRASPQLLARNLLIGSPERYIVAAAPTTLGVAPGWRQTVDIRTEEGVTVRLQSVSVKSGLCIFDWLLASPPDEWSNAEVESQFEGWIESFEHPGLLDSTPPVAVDGSNS
jgi:hypothetical protein